MAKLIKLTGKSFLREEPFGDPLIDLAPVQDHSFIFPGDEVFLYHIISLPNDAALAGATKMSDIDFVSAKVSLIAQKPQVFSAEFSQQFKSTRNFILDTYEVAFNDTNRVRALWGSDGYATKLLMDQPRNFRLPDGDMHKEIKFFTKHENATTIWDYHFRFPILFRWEYWISKLNTSLDFFDEGQPQDGLNEFWFHYFIWKKWRIVSRLELRLKVKGADTVIRTDLNLSKFATSINTYGANTDYNNKSIKTAKPGDNPSNTPAFIYGNNYTGIYAGFSKVTSWGADEQGKIEGFIWIEPQLGGGVSSRCRASSNYTITNDTAFLGLNTSVTDDSGSGIQTDAGDYITLDQAGNGVLKWFYADPKKLTLFAMLDPVKLAAIYPGQTKFTIYARLYNKTIVSGNILEKPMTKMGDEIKQDVILISPAQLPDTCEKKLPDCPFNLDVFADTGDSSDIKNDRFAFLQYAYQNIKAIKFTLQKAKDNCNDEWIDKAVIASDTYGKFFAYGKANDFTGDDFEDDYGKKYTGLLLEWRKVLNAFGAGRYRMKFTATDVSDVDTVTYDDHTFCLKAYNCNLANRSVRIEVVNQGLRGSLFDPTAIIDYALGWKSQYRLRGWMKYAGSNYDTTRNQYGDGSNNAFRPVTDEQRPKFILSIRPVPGWMDFILSTNVLQADEMYVTDYHSSNRHTFIKTPVMNDGEFKPVDNKLGNPLSSVDINLAYGLNNLRRRNS